MTHIDDNLQLSEQGVFRVDELPDGTLLVTLLATQRLRGESWGGGGGGERGEDIGAETMSEIIGVQLLFDQ